MHQNRKLRRGAPIFEPVHSRANPWLYFGRKDDGWFHEGKFRPQNRKLRRGHPSSANSSMYIYTSSRNRPGTVCIYSTSEASYLKRIGRADIPA